MLNILLTMTQGLETRYEDRPPPLRSVSNHSDVSILINAKLSTNAKNQKNDTMTLLKKESHNLRKLHLFVQKYLRGVDRRVQKTCYRLENLQKHL